MQSVNRQVVVPLIVAATVMIVLTLLFRQAAVVLWIGAVVLCAIALGASLGHQPVRNRILAACIFVAALVIGYVAVEGMPSP